MALIRVDDDLRVKKGGRFYGVLNGKIGPDESPFGLGEHGIPRNMISHLIQATLKNASDVFVPVGKIKHYLCKKIFGRRIRQVHYALNDFRYAMRAAGNMKAGYNA